MYEYDGMFYNINDEFQAILLSPKTKYTAFLVDILYYRTQDLGQSNTKLIPLSQWGRIVRLIYKIYILIKYKISKQLIT